MDPNRCQPATQYAFTDQATVSNPGSYENGLPSSSSRRLSSTTAAQRVYSSCVGGGGEEG